MVRYAAAFDNDEPELSSALLRYADIKKLWDRSSVVLRRFLVSQFHEVNGSLDIDVLRGNVVGPILNYLEKGCTDIEVVEMSEFDFKNYKYFDGSLNEFQSFCEENQLNSEVPDFIRETALRNKYGKLDVCASLARLEREYADYVPDWAVSYIDTIDYFKRLGKLKSVVQYKWARKALAMVSREDLELLEDIGDVFVRLALGGKGLFVFNPGNVVGVTVILKEKTLWFPSYEWKLVREVIQSRDFTFSVKEIRGASSLIIAEKGKEIIPVWIALNKDAVDPVKEYLDYVNSELGTKFDFVPENYYTGLYCAISNVMLHRSDWLIYLKLFPLLKGLKIRAGCSLPQAILNNFPKLQLKEDRNLAIAKVRIAEKEKSVILAYLDGSLKEAEKAGEQVNVWEQSKECKSVRDLTDVGSVVDWLRSKQQRQ